MFGGQKKFKIILLEIFDTELSSWIRKRIQKIELDSQEFHLKNYLKPESPGEKLVVVLRVRPPSRIKSQGHMDTFILHSKV